MTEQTKAKVVSCAKTVGGAAVVLAALVGARYLGVTAWKKFHVADAAEVVASAAEAAESFV